MGRSRTKNSCFKFITCAHGDEVDDEGPVASPESKISPEKRRWSFRKKSAGHQVPSSMVISEPACDNYNKENSDITANNFDHPKSSSVPEKSLTEETPDGIPQVSSVIVETELNAQSGLCQNSNSSDHNIKESDVIIIQAFIRGYLVRTELPKLKNVIKLQAAIRGHLVRRQAVGTLRCAQAIIKIQALIRARRARILSKKLDEQEEKKHKMDIPILEKRKACMESDDRCSSTKSIHSNGFACQLLESTPKTKPIYISNDPSKSDSAWKWLERWMAISSSEGPQHQKNFQGFQGQEENSKASTIDSGNEVNHAELSMSSDSKLAPCELMLPIAKTNVNLITKSSCDFEKDGQDQSQLENGATDPKQERVAEVNVQIENSASLLSQISMETAKTSELVHDFTTDSRGSDGNLEKHITIIDSSLPDALDYSRLCDSHFHLDSSVKAKDLIFLAENSFSHGLKVVAASECGTEISISSTLDSPDLSETGGEIILELGSLDRQEYDTNGCSDVPSMPGNVEAQTERLGSEPDRLEDYDKKLLNPTTAFEADMQSQEENSINATAPELQGTPTSQNSVNTNKNKRETRKPDGKLISQISKRSPRSSTEQLEKDPKKAKRRNSVGLDKLDHVDHEHRISTSDSLPSYMQATESARAKAHANVSPKSSPDLHNKENHQKKRHSLPIANGKQGSSPRMQRSPSQAQQNPKGNGIHLPHNSAERRWQR